MMIFTKFERTCSEEEETQCIKKVIEHADGRRTNSAQVSFNGCSPIRMAVWTMYYQNAVKIRHVNGESLYYIIEQFKEQS